MYAQHIFNVKKMYVEQPQRVNSVDPVLVPTVGYYYLYGQIIEMHL